jgi:alginate O-acetyltransferase complex protein AlgI
MNAPFGSLASIRNVEGIFSLGLWLSGAGHFCVLGASFQVPHRLHWNEDLQKLMPFNRKLMWVHGAFAIMTIVAFGVLTLVLHGEMLRGDRAALSLAAFIGLYWASRVAVDFLYYDHADWPEGKGFFVGHILLTLLFTYLAVANLGLVAWKVWGSQ